MPNIYFNSQKIPFKVGQSILDALIEFDFKPVYSCKKGVCQTCMLKSDSSQITQSQMEVKDTLKVQGYFLPCQCYPDSDISVISPCSEDITYDMQVSDKKLLTQDIVQLKLVFTSDNRVFIRAGQFINLKVQNDILRSYSVANTPEKDGYIELHIQKVPDGKMSAWCFEHANIGSALSMIGPFGKCIYLSDFKNDDLVLIGTGTGLAPLIGIINQALSNKHKGKITLFHGSRHFNGLYLHQTLKKLADTHENFYYKPCLSGEIPQTLADENINNGRVNKVAMMQLNKQKGDYKNIRFYLCGHPEMVKNMQKMAYLSGAILSKINADPFEYTAY
ncbi:FAD-binding oxidoreductase [Pseudoalteromonas denitrificans]|uniref:Ferredoxin-NADP reductase n=1 Tax=Pseudoalteromonas denitrificans DSM 6059 TaxID=1123010 RepID=A0A1I1FBL9_9GAMM|nr:FAD-binding oxidoreductase [Pseudoalteromonas denitrificans]SFB96372.1 Ferredoxin-NADP reductase [Pseudoalteromonas denitrificans DSM 6059]